MSDMDNKVSQRAKEWGIHPSLTNILVENEIKEFFPVQEAIIPLLLRLNSYSCVQPKDLCVSAPTGSGKTLSYAIPIVQLLSRFHDRQLRALIILPSRELATQVFGVFTKLLSHTHLKMWNATGNTDFHEEQQILTGPLQKRTYSEYVDSHFSNFPLYTRDGHDSRCNVDILVSTPGRLMDHIHQTKGFNLQHLRFLVLDEADRLLGNAYNYWVKSLIDSTRLSHKTTSSIGDHDYMAGDHHIVQRLLFSATLTDNPRKLGSLGIRNPMIVRIGTVNDDVGDDVEDIEDDGDRRSKFIPPAFILPKNLHESIRICDAEDRPVSLIAIILEALEDHVSSTSNDEVADPKLSFIRAASIQRCDGNICMIFASSVEATHRLCMLLKLINGQPAVDDDDQHETIEDHTSLRFGGRVEEISRVMNASARENTLRDAAIGKVRVIVSSDNMARGIDLANIKLVINYDPPKFLKTYVHRAGRTARANRSGHCLTLLKKGQSGAFKKMRMAIGDISEEDMKSKPVKYKVNRGLMEVITPDYQKALIRLQQIIADTDN